MPGDVASHDRLLHSFLVRGVRLLEILVNEPRSCGPDIPLFSGMFQRVCNLDRTWKILVEVLPDNRCLCVYETNIQMTLEHHQNLPDARIGRLCSRRGAFQRNTTSSANQIRYKPPTIHVAYFSAALLPGGLATSSQSQESPSRLPLRSTAVHRTMEQRRRHPVRAGLARR